MNIFEFLRIIFCDHCDILPWITKTYNSIMIQQKSIHVVTYPLEHQGFFQAREAATP